MPTPPTAGRTLVTRRALLDIVRTATLGSYGVIGFAASPLDRLFGRLGLSHPGISIQLADALDIELDLIVAYGVPVAEVARQVDSAIRYAVRKAIDRDVRRLTIHIDGLRFGPGGGPPSMVHVDQDPVGLADLADSGTDIA